MNKILTLKPKNEAPIGVFDSGIGGVTVLRALQSCFPGESFIYYADNGNIPYGTKTTEQIVTFSRNILTWFQEVQKVKMVVVACNTSSALALEQISGEFNIPIIGTILPLVQTVLKQGYKNLGILATPATAASKFHEKTLRAYGFEGNVQTIACPEFVPMIESQNFDIEDLRGFAKEYLKPFQNAAPDVLIYGCTHYPLIRNVIEPLLPPQTKTLCPSASIAQQVETFLNDQTMKKSKASERFDRFYCYQDQDEFAEKIKFYTDITNPRVEGAFVHDESSGLALRVGGEK